MFNSDEDKLNRAITALQAIAAYPDVDDLAELQEVVRRELSVLPTPRYHPTRPDIRTEEYHPRHFPPRDDLDQALRNLADPALAGFQLPTCLTCGCDIPCACLNPCIHWKMLTGFSLDADGRLLCLQYLTAPK